MIMPGMVTYQSPDHFFISFANSILRVCETTFLLKGSVEINTLLFEL